MPKKLEKAVQDTDVPNEEVREPNDVEEIQTEVITPKPSKKQYKPKLKLETGEVIETTKYKSFVGKQVERIQNVVRSELEEYEKRKR